MLFDVKGFCDRFSSDNDEGDLFSQKRKSWGHAVADKPEPRCDLQPGRSGIRFGSVVCVTLWKRSIYGRTLTELKSDEEMTGRFARETAEFIKRVIGENLSSGGWAVTTPPPRRHTERNFAQRTAAIMAGILGIPYYPDVANPPKNRQRVNAEYTLHRLPEEPNLIVYDDIVTTGSTLTSMWRLLSPLGKTILNVASINNN